MKRSDALDIIDEVLYEHELPLLQGISKEILGRLEKVGMKPPAQPFKDGEIPPCGLFGIFEWEKE